MRLKAKASDRSASRVSPTAPKEASLSAAVWAYLESIPGFNDRLREAEEELEGGGGVLYEVRGNALRKAQLSRRAGTHRAPDPRS